MKKYEFLRLIGQAFEGLLKEYFNREMGFFIVVTEFCKTDKETDFISNILREDAVKALRETADRLENNQFIPPVIGEA